MREFELMNNDRKVMTEVMNKIERYENSSKQSNQKALFVNSKQIELQIYQNRLKESASDHEAKKQYSKGKPRVQLQHNRRRARAVSIIETKCMRE